MEKKSGKSTANQNDNSFGLASTILGIMGIIFATSDAVGGIILSVIALVFASKQNKEKPTKWSKWGKILGIFGLILNIVLLVVTIVFIIQNFDKISQLGEMVYAK